jgi:phytoene dehydrogenase-like protein
VRHARRPDYDAVIVGAGPNGLSAGIVLATSGACVLIVEREDSVGGGCRTRELTGQGFRHDVCSAIHPLAAGSPFFRSLPLERYGLEWVQPDLPLAHPVTPDEAVSLHRSIERTAGGLASDGDAYRRLIEPLVEDVDALFALLLGPIRPTMMHAHSIPTAARFGLAGIRSASALARSRFKTVEARALLAGLSAHSVLRLDQAGSAAFGLALALAGHAFGWPFPRGGAQTLADALASHFADLGGKLELGAEARSLDDLPTARAYLFDTTPRQMLDIAGSRIQGLYRRQARRFRHGPGVFKIDYALSAPIPWQAEACRRAGTVHVGGTLEDVEASELAVLEGHHSHRPFVLVGQHSLFDETRAPEGHHTAWTYCHVPNGSTVDMQASIEAQIERFAPGFRDVVVTRHVMNAAELERYNPNYIGGDISSGRNNLLQMLARPVLRVDPYSTSDPAIFICSASTPPGGGVHGMCGYRAARRALRRLEQTSG